jgi:hypothetical protein
MNLDEACKVLTANYHEGLCWVERDGRAVGLSDFGDSYLTEFEARAVAAAYASGEQIQ